MAAALAAALGLVLALVAPAWACNPQASLSVSSQWGPAGTTVRITGQNFFNAGEIELSWYGHVIQPLATLTSPHFRLDVTIPLADPGSYPIVAVQRDPTSPILRASTMFEVTAPPPARGYWMVAADGGIFAFGDAGFFGSTGGIPLHRPIVGMAATPSGKGYWLAAADGGIFAFGDAGFFGSTGGIPLQRPIVGMAATPSGRGYWLAASDGGIFAFGDAGFFGSVGGIPVLRPIVGMAATIRGTGYWVVADNGQVFAFGQTGSSGSVAGSARPKPVIGMAPSGSGRGYWLADSGGGIATSGDASLHGSTADLALARPVVGVAASGSGNGYWLTASDGGVFAFGDAGFFGSTGGIRLDQPIVGMRATRWSYPPPPPGLVCRNSTDPACGPFRWDPEPVANQPVLASFIKAPPTAVAGQPVTFEVAWSDPEARLTSWSFGGPDRSSAFCPDDRRFGPWTPPTPVPSSGTVSHTTTYPAAATYQMVVSLYVGEQCQSPYMDFRQLRTTIVVTAAPPG